MWNYSNQILWILVCNTTRQSQYQALTYFKKTTFTTTFSQRIPEALTKVIIALILKKYNQNL